MCIRDSPGTITEVLPERLVLRGPLPVPALPWLPADTLHTVLRDSCAARMDAHPFRALRKAHALWQAGGWATRGLAIMVLTDEHRRLDQGTKEKHGTERETVTERARLKARQRPSVSLGLRS